MSNFPAPSGAERQAAARQRKVLWLVMGINAAMFVIIAVAALSARSSALLSDSLDNLGDAFTYALSLWALSRCGRSKAAVAMLKGVLILLAALAVALQAGYRVFVPVLPLFEMMGSFSVLGLFGNGVCLLLLARYRDQDVNMASVWECSRTDMASNLSVLLAAGAVAISCSGWPDLLLASALVLLLIGSALRIMRQAWRELRLPSSAWRRPGFLSRA